MNKTPHADRRLPIVGLTFLSLYLSCFSASAVDPTWKKIYRSPLEKECDPDVLTYDYNGSLIVGVELFRKYANSEEKYSIALTKYRKETGNIVWSIVQNPPNGGSYELTDIGVDSENNIVLTGTVHDGDLPSDVYVAKFDGASGDVIWKKNLDLSSGKPDNGVRLAIDSNDDIFIGGTIGTSSNEGNVVALKVSGQNGVLQWQGRHRTLRDKDDYPKGFAISTDGVYVSANLNIDHSGGSAIMKFDIRNGNLLWSKSGPSGSGDIVVDADGNPYMGGTDTDYYAYAEKRNPETGAIIWQKSTRQPGEAYIPPKVSLDKDQNFVAAWRIPDLDGGHIIKYKGDTGAVIWAKELNRYIYDIAIYDSDIYICGYAQMSNSQYYYVGKLKPGGAKEWESFSPGAYGSARLIVAYPDGAAATGSIGYRPGNTLTTFFNQ